MEQTVQKALNLLEALVRSGQPRRLTELARQLGLTKPNVYRLLSTLSVLGYVKKDADTSLYSPTLKIWEMGSLLVRDVDLVSVASPRLRRLCDEMRGVGAAHGVRRGLRGVRRQGRQRAAAQGDDQHRLAACRPRSPRRARRCSPGCRRSRSTWPSSTSSAITPLTLTRRKDIERDLEETRARGYAINRGEFRVGVCGIGVPIRDRTGGVVAAIGVWGAEKNILGPRREELAQLARRRGARHLAVAGLHRAARPRRRARP